MDERTFQLLPALQVLGEALFIADADGRLVWLSDAAKGLLPGGAESFIGQHLSGVVLGGDVALFEGARKRAAQGEGPQRLPRHWAPQGHPPFDLQLTAMPSGQLLVLAKVESSAHDIFARAVELERKARADVEAAERRQAFLFQAMNTLFSHPPDVSGMLTLLAHLGVPDLADWCLVHALESSGSALTHAVAHLDPQESALAEALTQRLPYRPAAPAGVQRVLVTGETEVVPAVTDSLVRASAAVPEHALMLTRLAAVSYMIIPLRARGHTLGTVTFVSSRSRRLYGPEDVALAEDLCQRASLAIDNARLFAEARKATLAREDLLAMVSHDLKSPLQSVQLGAALLERPRPGQPRDEAVLKNAERIRHAAESMTRLINDLLDWGRLEAGQLPLEPTRQSASGILTDATELTRAQAEAKGVSLELSFPEHDLHLQADRVRVVQVLTNLLSNALKFTPPTGRISLSVARHNDDSVIFTVSDTGKGIPPEQLPHIFDRYWQAKDAVHRGAGLGLAIARGIVEGHGGAIWARSTEGAGTTVSFTLPFEASSAREPVERV